MLLRSLARRSTIARRGLATAKPPDPKPHTMAAVGATAGTLGSLAGMGGGFVAIPLMTRLGVSQHTAHGTSLVGVVCTGAAGAAAYAADGAVDVKAAAAVAAVTFADFHRDSTFENRSHSFVSACRSGLELSTSLGPTPALGSWSKTVVIATSGPQRGCFARDGAEVAG